MYVGYDPVVITDCSCSILLCVRSNSFNKDVKKSARVISPAKFDCCFEPVTNATIGEDSTYSLFMHVEVFNHSDQVDIDGHVVFSYGVR